MSRNPCHKTNRNTEQLGEDTTINAFSILDFFIQSKLNIFENEFTERFHFDKSSMILLV